MLVRHAGGAGVPRSGRRPVVDDPSRAEAVFVAHADAVDFPSLETAARA